MTMNITLIMDGFGLIKTTLNKNILDMFAINEKQ